MHVIIAMIAGLVNSHIIRFKLQDGEALSIWPVIIVFEIIANGNFILFIFNYDNFSILEFL